MSLLAPDLILSTFLVFCRIGACLMLMPGFSSLRVPPQVRLFIVFGITLALSPVVVPGLLPTVGAASQAGILSLIVTETLIGAQIGIIGRIFYLALQTLAHASAMLIGFGAMPGAPIDEIEPIPALGSLVMMSATALFFIANLHWEVFRGLVVSYDTLPPAAGFDARTSLVAVSDRIGEAFLLALRISAPFVIFAFLANFAIGVMNKLAQQIPIYFVAMPAVLMAGLFIVYFLVGEYLALFAAGFADWLRTG
ncbi:flagellar biosynthetic protein FliR [Salinarimonas ramus]|uniref:Flagellar biosynthesis protein FliR n=1 Tax=Salinarimonas ramus TaxID=690164 RepID=A0A917Q7H9_9HYPH|nr:flagellar biosynthetic protein FliR [Salinarimonas ramus]GGK33717.1 flagellar biosynthesis protein FliR [Salinarimonas ramus]